jgi:hypothetical protein
MSCQAGTHCVSGRCAAECSASHPCVGGAACSTDGTCGATGDAGHGGHDGAFVPTDAPPVDTTCAAVNVGTQLATPNVIVIVDRSGSMGSNDFPPGSGTTRWTALETALMAPGGLVDMLQGSVRWGMLWFDAPRTGTCPRTPSIACALNNYTAINNQYRTLQPGGGTPTGEAINQIVANPSALISDPSQPTILILATDGDPNGCNGDANVGLSTTVTAITRAHNMGINTYVIGVGDATSSNLQMMADAGAGTTGAMWWQPTDTTSLSNALSTIVGGVRTCNLTLSGMLDVTQACTGTVTLAGAPLTCNGPDGWHAVDATHITIDGSACTGLLAGATPLVATFPCGVVVM